MKKIFLLACLVVSAAIYSQELDEAYLQSLPEGVREDVLNKIEKQREATNGNYDGLFAKVVNFDWTFQPDGSYDISIKLASLGDVVESFKVNILTPSTELKETPGFESNSGDLTDDKVNKSTMSNFLESIKRDTIGDIFTNIKRI